MYSQIPSSSSKKRGRNADTDESAVAPIAMVCGDQPGVASSGGLATRNFNFMASAAASPSGMGVTMAPTTTIAAPIAGNGSSAVTGGSQLSQQQQQQQQQEEVREKSNNNNNNNNKNNNSKSKNKTNKSKEDILNSLGLLPSMAKIRVKSCDPTAGLTLGGVQVTPEQLANLSPTDLNEHMLMRNGEPLEVEELAQLLGMEDYDESALELEGGPEEDELILGMIEAGMLDMFLQNMNA